jgi:tryptophan synthase beta chain
VVRHARNARASNEPTVILFNLSGHGVFDLSAYDTFLTGKMVMTA